MVAQDVGEVNGAQPEAKTEIGVSQTGWKHGGFPQLPLAALKRFQELVGWVEACETHELVSRSWWVAALDPPTRCGENECDYYYFFGASPNFLSAFFMTASKRLRALAQASSLSGTWHLPIALHLFSPGVSPQPPRPRQAFSPAQV